MSRARAALAMPLAAGIVVLALPSTASAMPFPAPYANADVLRPTSAAGTRPLVASAPEDELSCLPDPVLQSLFDQAGVPNPAGEHPVGDAVSKLYATEDQVPLPSAAPDPARGVGNQLTCAAPYVQPPAPPAAPAPPGVEEPAVDVGPSTPPSGRSGVGTTDLGHPGHVPGGDVTNTGPAPTLADLSGAHRFTSRLRSDGVAVLAALLLGCAAGAVALRRLLGAELFPLDADDRH